MRTLYDVLENRDYGTYFWRNPGDKKFWEVAPSKCEVKHPSGEMMSCQSDEQFTVLAPQNMES